MIFKQNNSVFYIVKISSFGVLPKWIKLAKNTMKPKTKPQKIENRQGEWVG